MKLPFIHIKNLSLSTSALWVLLERTLALFTRTFTMYFITLLLIQPDLTWLYRYSLEGICIITNCCSFLHGPVVISHQEWLYLSGAKDNNGKEALHGDPRDDGGRADEGKDTNRVEKKEWMCVMVRKGEREMWQSEGGNTIKGNECQSVIPAVWSRCLCQLSWHPEVWSRSPSHWVNARFQCQMLALL